MFFVGTNRYIHVYAIESGHSIPTIGNRCPKTNIEPDAGTKKKGVFSARTFHVCVSFVLQLEQFFGASSLFPYAPIPSASGFGLWVKRVQAS